MNEYPNIFVSRKRYEQISEYICIKRNNTNIIWMNIHIENDVCLYHCHCHRRMICSWWPPLSNDVYIICGGSGMILGWFKGPRLERLKLWQTNRQTDTHTKFQKLWAVLYYISCWDIVGILLGFCWDFVGMTIQGPKIVGMDPNYLHPNPRPTTPQDFIDSMIFLYQKEMFLITRNLSIFCNHIFQQNSML